MRARCRNPRDSNYHNYGGRGITVDPRWEDFAAFRDDMGDRPAGADLGRIDNDLGYSKSNCRWESRLENANNRRDNRPISFGGETLTLSQWGRKTGVGKTAIAQRLRRGWSVEKALTVPLKKLR